tara:strand:+ start:490 stop:603 length:114 start_codon:yes stop_codon:yes gene_type:complete
MNTVGLICIVLDSACFSILGVQEGIKEFVVAYKIKLV